MTKLDWKTDLDKSCNIIENPYLFDRNIYTHHSRIFNFRTINHKELFLKMQSKWKKYLGVMASTNPMLNAISMGCKNITVFDINILNVYFMYLSIAAVISLEYQEFIDYFYSVDINKFFNKFYFFKLKNELSPDVYLYWESLYEKYPVDKLVNLFFYGMPEKGVEEGIKQEVIPSNIFLEEKEFYHLKKELLKIKLRYFINDFGDIPFLLRREKFDTIYLSCMQNLIYDNVHGYNYFNKLKEYESLLAKEGCIQGGYLYLQDLEDETWYQYNREHFKENGYRQEKINIVPNEDNGAYCMAFIKRK